MKTVFCWVALLLPLSATSPATSESLSGQVCTETGAPAAAVVTVTSPGGYLASVETDRQGEFLFPALPAGRFHLRVTDHRYAIYERDITLLPDAGIRDLAVRLLVPVNQQTISVADLLHQQ